MILVKGSSDTFLIGTEMFPQKLIDMSSGYELAPLNKDKG